MLAGISTIEVLIVIAMVCVVIGFACLKLVQGNRTTSTAKVKL